MKEKEEFRRQIAEKGKKENLVGQNLKRILKEKKMRQIDLARALGVQKQQISKYCSGDGLPSIYRLFIIADILKVQLQEFFLEEEEGGYMSTGRTIKTQPLLDELFRAAVKLDGDQLKTLIKVCRSFK